MDWSDQGIVLSARRHGESSLVAQVFTREHGRHAGLARGGAGARARGLYQPGNLVAARWRGRLAEHLGSYVCELTRANAAAVIDDPARLACLASVCSLAEAALPERHPYPALFDATRALAGLLATAPDWAGAYVRWELGLLDELGYGLDLAACAATGARHDLIYVSPRTGRAVGAEAGAPYAERLLALPPFLTGKGGAASATDVAAGLRLTGYFIERRLFAPHDRQAPPARERFVGRILRATTISGGIKGS